VPAGRDLASAMVRFGALLREHGLPITVVQVTDAVRALEHVDLADRDEVRLALRAVFTGRPEDIPPFDRCFEAFWRPAAEEAQGLPGLIAIPSGE
jgi:uncharacterized protein with von Willebrand factor type A (vWA) domain